MKYFTRQTSKQTAEGTDRSINAHPLHLNSPKVRQIRRRRARKNSQPRRGSAVLLQLAPTRDGGVERRSFQRGRSIAQDVTTSTARKPNPLDAVTIFPRLMETDFLFSLSRVSLPE